MSDPSEGAWRLIVHPAADGAWNMAVDEALLESCARRPDDSPPTLRLYGWTPPALSLGRSQPAAASCDLHYLRAEAIDLVRRPTGGRAVLHELERTYAVVGSLAHPPFDGGVHQVYRRIGRALREGLRRLGVSVDLAAGSTRSPSPRQGDGGRPACFDGPGAHEVIADELKVIGSAQLRRRRAFLQHGSILLDSDAQRLARAVGSPSPLAGFTDLRRILGHGVQSAELDRALIEAFQELFGVRMDDSGLSDDEARRAAQLRCWKYDSAAWTLDGETGERERRWGPDLSR